MKQRLVDGLIVNGRAHATRAILCAGALAASGCTGETPASGSTVPSIFENPPELEPNADGVYELNFGPSEVQFEGKRYCLRVYNGATPGPTIRVPAGTDRKVHVNLHNHFTKPDYRLVGGAFNTSRLGCHDFNLTNLHAHGTHIQPNYASADPADPCMGNGCAPDARYYADNVLIDVGPGESARYRWDLDEDGPHHEGLDWYHPHIHGSTAAQVTNGAAGALIIEGELDTLAGIAKAKERIMILSQVAFGSETTRPLADGESCTEDTLSMNDFGAAEEAGKPTLINGKLRPHVKTSPNQIERLRLVYAGTPDEIGIKLHVGKDANCDDFELMPIEITQVARDGMTLPKFYKSDTMWISPGYRIESVVKMPAEKQTLCMVGRRVNDLLGSVFAIIDVDPANGEATETNMPEESAIAAIAKPTTWTGMVDGQMQEVSCDSVKTIHQKVALLVPTPGEEPMPGSHDDLGSCDPADHNHAPDPAGPVCICPAPNINCRSFEDRRARKYRSDRVMQVGATEKWDVRAFDGHPFHIHTNPFLVCPNTSNKEPNFAHWRDTFWVQIDDGPQELLTTYSKFTGQFVLHCHKLNHEDMGMMELVEICPEGDTTCLCQGTDAQGNCISQAACQTDDLQCQFAKAATEAFPLPPAPNPALCGP
jgi:L-ascorbate oxidase